MLFVGCVKEHTKIGRSSPLTSRLMISTLEIFIEFVIECRTVSRNRYVYSLSFILDTRLTTLAEPLFVTFSCK